MADEGLTARTATEAAAEIARGAISSEDYTRACLDRIAALDGEIKAFVHLDREHALAQARALDDRRVQGHAIGPLHGIPVAIKDIIDTADYPTELGSPLAAGPRPPPPPTAPAGPPRCAPPAQSSSARRCRPSPPIPTPVRRAPRTPPPPRPAPPQGARRRGPPPAWCRPRSPPNPRGRSPAPP